MNAKRTRYVVGLMRDAVRTVERKQETDRVYVKLSRAHGRRRYSLVVTDGSDTPMYSGCPVMFDATRGELWVRPGTGGLDELRRVRAMGKSVNPGRGVTPEHETVLLPTMIEHRGVGGYGYCVVCGMKSGNTRYGYDDCQGAWVA